MNNQRLLKVFFVSAFFICICSSMMAERLTSIPEINKPYRFEVFGDHIYIGEQSSISLYSLKNFSLIKKFGRRGEGPGEFKSIPMLKVFPRYLVVNNFGKWLLFSRTGDFIKERSDTLFKPFLFPVGRNYVATIIDSSPKIKNTVKIISLLDEELEPIKEIARKAIKVNKGGRRESHVIKDFFQYRIYDDKIFIGNTEKGFYIEVFDESGNKLYVIEKDYRPIKVTVKYKQDFLQREKKSNDFIAKSLRRYKYKYVFRDYFPAFQDFRVKDGNIYVFTNKRKDDQGEILVMDLTGKILKGVFVTKAPLTKCSISKNRYYYLKDNIDKEEWELFSENL
jgi:hypothetical protein